MLDNLENIKKIHVMGMGGAGMSSLAKILSGLGYEVTGCDLEHGHYLDELEELNIKFLNGHSPEHIALCKPDLLIYTSAVREDNLELQAARDKNIKVVKRGEALSWLFNKAKGVGVAGAHGKTTTSSMISLILSRAGLSPTLYVGAEMRDMGTNAILGRGDLFLSELDESDGSFELFKPFVSVITNIDWDHADHFKTREDYINAFIRFIDNRKSNGALVICNDDEGSKIALNKIDKSVGPVFKYGLNNFNLDWSAANINHKLNGGSSCEIYKCGVKAGNLNLKVSGEHNILNALAAIAAVNFLGVGFDEAIKILADFHGAERRLQIKGVKDDVLVIDDYAHHHTEIKATLNAVKNIYPGKKIILAFQPHRYTRTAIFLEQLAKSLSMADKIFLLPVFEASEDYIKHGTSDSLAEEINKIKDCVLCNNFDEALKLIKLEVKAGDILLTMGAGTIYILGEKFLES